MYEAQVASLQQQLAALEEKRKKDIEDVRAAAAAEKKAALTQQKKELLSKYEVVRMELVKAQELSIDGALARIDEICKELRVFYEQNINNEIA
jgi:polyhydroxyalkanoate synthesis regulator phasin